MSDRHNDYRDILGTTWCPACGFGHTSQEHKLRWIPSDGFAGESIEVSCARCGYILGCGTRLYHDWNAK